jgi:hypothetical protein
VLATLAVNENDATLGHEDHVAQLLGHDPIAVAVIKVAVGRELQPDGRAADGAVGEAIHRSPPWRRSADAFGNVHPRLIIVGTPAALLLV